MAFWLDALPCRTTGLLLELRRYLALRAWVVPVVWAVRLMFFVVTPLVVLGIFGPLGSLFGSNTFVLICFKEPWYDENWALIRSYELLELIFLFIGCRFFPYKVLDSPILSFLNLFPRFCWSLRFLWKAICVSRGSSFPCICNVLQLKFINNNLKV